MDFTKMIDHSTRKGLLKLLSLVALFCSVVEAQVDDFSEEEADYFRSQKIYPLVVREQDGDYPRSTYLIPHDITIPRGKVMTIYPGCTLLFKKDTRLIVKGTVIAKGKEANPVLFCKLDNSDYYTSVDSMVDTKWDGIFVKDSGRIEFQYTHVTNSKYGVVLDGPVGDVILDSVQFYENRYQNLKVGQKEITVKPYQNMFYKTNGILDGTKLSSGISDSIKTRPDMSVKEKPPVSKSLRRFRATMWTGIVAGGLIGVSGHFIHIKYHKRYDNVDEYSKDPVKTVTKYRTISKIGEGMRIGGAGLAGLSIIGLTISIAF
jgi:hypothetical protein